MDSIRLRHSVYKIAPRIVAFIIVLLPFHALLTTWAGSNFGHIDVWRIWKELLCVPLGFICLWTLLYKPKVRRQVTGSPVFWLAVAYSLLSVVMGLWAMRAGEVNGPALVYGLLANVRLVVFLVFAWIVGLQSPRLYKYWRQLVLVPALLVVSFGVLQLLVLPADFLRHFGYGPDTIPIGQTVDQQAGYQRVQSTLRGANPLGAYLVLILTAFAALLARQKERRRVGVYLVVATGVVLLVTYSRSAYLGAALGLAVLAWHVLPSAVWRRRFVAVSCAALLGVTAAVVVLRNNDVVQNTVFHSSEASPSQISSNASRSGALKAGLRDVAQQPLGRGTGTAGPASFRNNHPPRIAENYYIQLAQEVGVLGLGLFVAINAYVARELWRRRRDALALILLASLVGLTLVNMLSHAWTDDTLGMLWWGLAGIALSQPASGILKKEQIKHG